MFLSGVMLCVYVCGTPTFPSSIPLPTSSLFPSLIQNWKGWFSLGSQISGEDMWLWSSSRKGSQKGNHVNDKPQGWAEGICHNGLPGPPWCELNGLMASGESCEWGGRASWLEKLLFCCRQGAQQWRRLTLLGGRGQGIHVLRGQGGSGSKWKRNISVPAVSPQHPPHPHPGRATFPWNDANGVIRVSVSKIKSVTPFCRLIISTFRLQGDSITLEEGAASSQGWLKYIALCVCVYVCVCVCVYVRAHPPTRMHAGTSLHVTMVLKV